MIPLSQHLRTIRQLATLPSAELIFERAIAPEHIAATYANYTKPHPRYRIVRNKTWGAALIDLQRYVSLEQYLYPLRGRNGAAYHARRARSRGYVLEPIDRNAHAEAIHDINTAIEHRQGRPMDAAYRVKRTEYERLPHFHHYGVFGRDGKLMGYADVGRFGNFYGVSRLIGYRNNDGFMHMLVVDIVERLLREERVRYFMYDTFFGASAGLRQFKTHLGFTPYRAKYSLQ